MTFFKAFPFTIKINEKLFPKIYNNLTVLNVSPSSGNLREIAI